MLTVSVLLDSGDQISALEVTGHTEIAPSGQDLACAAASALVQTSILGIQKVLGVTTGVEIEEGHAYITVPGTFDMKTADRMNVILKTTLAGLEEIGKNYPGSVEIIYENIETIVW